MGRKITTYAPDSAGTPTVRDAECDVGSNGGLPGWCFDHQDFTPCTLFDGRACECEQCKLEAKLQQAAEERRLRARGQRS